MEADQEPDVVTGNHFNKYESTNPIVRHLMRRFHAAFDTCLAATDGETATEVGCGEGYLTERLLQRGLTVGGCDISPRVIRLAQERLKPWPDVRLEVGDILAMEAESWKADLVVCCEVLEHLPDPDAALEVLAGISNRWLIASVPHEPWWRVLNVARGKYLGALGNTPGHIQHWSQRGFVTLIESRFDVVQVQPVFPWTMLLARVR